MILYQCLRPSLQVCPMNTSAQVDPQKSGHAVWEEFSQSFTPAVKEVVEFAKKIPGFRDLSQHDQVSLLKAGTFEVRALTPVARQSPCPTPGLSKVAEQVCVPIPNPPPPSRRCWWCVSPRCST